MSGLSKPQVLLTNDDGFSSPLLVPFAIALSRVAIVRVVVPATGQSGVSHAFSGFEGHSLDRVPGDFPFEFYKLSGTPADCAKFALRKLYGNLKFDCVLSGPNEGENAGVSSIYSGTVAGAREAVLWGVPGIALSLPVHSSPAMQAELSRFAARVVEERLYARIPAHAFWNVNFPDADAESFCGYRVARQNLAMFTDHYVEKDGKWYLEGEKTPSNFAHGSDDLLLSQGFATVTPMTIDQTLQGDIVPLENTIGKFFEAK